MMRHAQSRPLIFALPGNEESARRLRSHAARAPGASRVGVAAPYTKEGR
jgi:hypothetical protein